MCYLNCKIKYSPMCLQTEGYYRARPVLPRYRSISIYIVGNNTVYQVCTWSGDMSSFSQSTRSKPLLFNNYRGHLCSAEILHYLVYRPNKWSTPDLIVRAANTRYHICSTPQPSWVPRFKTRKGERPDRRYLDYICMTRLYHTKLFIAYWTLQVW